MEGSGSPLTALHYHGRPYKVAERIVTMLMERRYCMPGDVLMWAISYRRNQQPFSEQDKKMLIKIEIEGDGNGVSVCSD